MRIRSTVRFRLTVLYGALFLLTGLILLGVSFAIVRANIDDEVGLERERVYSDLIEAGVPPENIQAVTEAPLGDGRTVGEAIVDTAVSVRSNVLDDLLVAYAVAIPLVGFFALGLGWLAAGRALRPVKQLTQTAQKLGDETLHERIALEGPDDELKQLADTLDAMIARLEVAFLAQRRFAADVSHEVRTPLSIIKAEADVTLADAESSERERRLANSVLEAADRAESLIDSLLALARSESTMRDHELVDLAELTGDVVGERVPAADSAGVQVELDLGSATVSGDPFLLERLVANLVDNGINHNVTSDGWVRVAVDSQNGRTLLEVSNTGQVLSAAEAEHIAEPFHRLGEPEVPGFGLGMTIVRSVAKAHGGDVAINPRHGGGLDVLVSLPVEPATASL